MAWTSGIADNYIDLLRLLREYLDANGHTILHYSTTQFYCKSPGLDGLDEIYWGIDTFENPASSRYNWEIAGSVSYKEGRGGISHPGTSKINTSTNTYIYLWNQAIPYWFAVNGRRVVVLAKVGTVFQFMYAGLALPLGAVEQYPYPLVIGGCGHSSTSNYATTTYNQLFFGTNTPSIGPISGPGRFLTPAGIWYTIAYCDQPAYAGYSIYVRSLTQNFRSNIVPALDGSYLLEELILTGYFGTTNRYYEYPCAKLDGVFKVSGKNNSAENIISVDGGSYLVFPDTWRSTIGDYFAVKME